MSMGDREPQSDSWRASEHDTREGYQNWSGSLRFRPSRAVAPRSEEELAQIIGDASRQGRTVRPVGSMHSSTGIIATDDILVSLDHFRGVYSVDQKAHRAEVGAGTVLRDLGKRLSEIGLAMPNYGDVATQTIAGAIGTGTHGSGIDLYNLSMTLVGGSMVTGSGAIKTFSLESDPDLVRAMRVSFGTLGILTRIELQLEPDYQLHRQEWCTTFDAVFPRLCEFAAENRNFDLYWYPRSDEVKLRCLNPPGEGPDYSSFAWLAESRTGAPHEVIPKHSDLPDKFDEMEYAFAADAARDCLLAIRDRIRSRWRRTVCWRVLYRFVKADDTWLSEAHARETATISLHQNSSLPFRDYFADIEPIFQSHGGRPHWAKIHTMTGAQLGARYPMWRRFGQLRRELDPDGVLLTPYLRGLLAPQMEAAR